MIGTGRTGYVLVPLIAVALAYLNAFRGVFQLDDYNVIVFNPSVHSWSAFWQECFHGIRPFLKFTYTLCWTSPTGVFSFHAFNLAVHLASVFLVFNLTLSFLKGRPGTVPEKALYPAACLAALLFGLHPIQTEAVTYITGRSASLMTMFYLGSLAAYAKGTREKRWVFLYLVSPVLFLLAAATKETAVTLPFALLLWETAAGQGTGFRRALKKQSVHWVLFALLVTAVLAHPRYRALLLFSLDLRGFKENLIGQVNSTAHVLSHLVMPGRLNIDPGTLTPAGWFSVPSLVVSSLAVLAAAGIWKKKPWLWFGVLWFFLHMMVINVLVPRIDGVSDRHFYQASWGIFLPAGVAAAWFSSLSSDGRRLFTVFAVSVSIILGGYTIVRNRVYHSETALWEDTVRKSPHNPRAFNNLGYACYLEGRRSEARAAYRRALEIDPSFEHARNNLNMLDGH